MTNFDHPWQLFISFDIFEEWLMNIKSELFVWLVIPPIIYMYATDLSLKSRSCECILIWIYCVRGSHVYLLGIINDYQCEIYVKKIKCFSCRRKPAPALNYNASRLGFYCFIFIYDPPSYLGIVENVCAIRVRTHNSRAQFWPFLLMIMMVIFIILLWCFLYFWSFANHCKLTTIQNRYFYCSFVIQRSMNV